MVFELLFFKVLLCSPELKIGNTACKVTRLPVLRYFPPQQIFSWLNVSTVVVLNVCVSPASLLFSATTRAAKGKGKAAPAAVKAAPAAAAPAAEVDKCCPKAGNKGVYVCAGHDAKMNQTNIASNNNKFYILQVP